MATEIPVFDVAALRQWAAEPVPADDEGRRGLWGQLRSDVLAAADYIDELLELLEGAQP